MTSTYTAFGLRFTCDFPLPELTATGGDGVDLRIALASGADVVRAFSGPVDPPAVHETVLGDGLRYFVERGAAGDYRIEYGELARFHLSAGGRVLQCAPAAVEAPAWRRFLLDTALGTASLAQGFDAMHAAAYLGASGIVAVAAGTGGGKSSLLAELIRRHHTFVTDDILAISRVGDVVHGHCGPAVVNLAPRLPDGTDPAALGRVIANVDGERWVALDREPPAPAPVTAVVILDRGDHAAVELHPEAANPMLLLPHALNRGPTQQHERERFELFADLATQAALFTLRAPMAAPTGATAAALAAL